MTEHNPKRGLIRHAEIEQLAKRVLKQQGITEPPIPVRKIADNLGILVRSQPFTGDSDAPAESNVSAVLKRDGDKVVIGVNSTHTATRQRFSIAHELGHYYLHKDEQLFIDFGSTIRRPSSRFRNEVSSQATDRDEIEANTFAAALLMPKGMVRKKLEELLDASPDISTEYVVDELAHIFHVSKDAMNFRLLNLRLLITLG